MVVDASIWVSNFVPHDAHHRVARLWLEQRLMAEDDLVVPTLVFPEVAGAVSRRTGDPVLGHDAAAGVLQTLRLRTIPLSDRLASESVRVAADYRLRGADAVYVAVADSLRAPLATLDQEVQTRAAGLVTIIVP